MRRNALPTLEDLDIDARDIAEAMARRSGLSLEEWLATALAERAGTQGPRAKPERRRAGDELDGIIARMMETSRKRPAGSGGEPRPVEPDARDEASRTAIALESMASWIEHAEERLNESARLSADQQDRMASALSQALATLKNRLDEVERQVVSERAVPARIEFPVQDAIKALTPLSDTLSGLRTDMSRLTERLEQPINAVLPPAIDGIRDEIERLRTSVEGLATRDEIAALDRAVRDLSKDIEQGRPNKDILTLAQSVAAVHQQVQTLSGDLADGVHRRLSSEIDEIKGKIDSAARSGIDRSVIDFLAGQIVDLRHDLAHRAEPQQIERLSGEVGTLSRQVAELRSNQVGRGDFAALKTSLENVCHALNRTVSAQEASTVPEQLESLSRRLDVLASRPDPEPANLDPIAEQLSVLTDRMASISGTRLEQTDTLAALMERLSAQVQSVAERSPVAPEPLLERFDRIEEELRQVGRQADTSGVAQMLQTLSEKFERPAAPSALDGLEQKIAAMTEQLARTPAEPFRQAFEEATSHLRKLQDETALIAERAARTALKDVGSSAPASDDIDALKQGFVELKALQTRADRKTQETLRSVRDALEMLVSRHPERGILTPPSVEIQAPAAGRAPGEMPSADRLEAAVRRLHAAALSQIAEVSGAPSEASLKAEPLKAPAEQEPARSVAASFSPQETDLGSVRASFIAAARRAAQTSAPDKAVPADPLPAEEAAAAPEAPESLPPETGALSAPSLIERLRRSFDSHRRPLLFSLAFLVLAAGAAQILSVGPGEETPPAVRQAAVEAPREQTAASVASAPAPQVENSLFQPTSLAATTLTPAKFLVDPSTVGELPAQVPTILREAALAGDAAAIYEIASQASEGRGLSHDPILAAHLFERSAQAGYAPAQERLAMLYEKGVGVLRDTKLAATWYERAAQGGNVRAMHNLATLLASGANGRPDYPAALRWYREAAESGVRDSQFNLGVLLARGIGTSTDLVGAFKWFSLAAAQSDTEAAKKRDGIAVSLNPKELAAGTAALEGWQPRFVDPSANGSVAAGGQTAALDPAVGSKS
ncbi:hypothetical protein ACFOYU_20535 [Microvirga sp. GCM10011540]|uniref:hypothetical protein n=1 Tax=Microvirga sp. GCM10011540 TaxID=3317338 RepID=UPI00360F7F3B